MAILWCGTSLADVPTFTTPQCIVSTIAADLAPYVPEGIAMDYINNSGGADTPDIRITDQFSIPMNTEHWISFYLDCGDFTNNNWHHHVWALRDTSYTNNPILAFHKPINSTSIKIFRANGASWVDHGVITYPSQALVRFDIKVDFNSDGTGGFEIFYDGVSAVSYTGNLYVTGQTQCNELTFQREGGNADDRTLSAIIVADQDTRDLRLQVDYPTGNGALTDWTGDYLNADGTGTDTGDSITANLSGDKETFTFPAIDAALQSSTPVAAGVNISGEAIGTFDLKGLTRVSATNYESSVLATGSGTKRGLNTMWANNPNTGIAWTVAQIEGAEFGASVT